MYFNFRPELQTNVDLLACIYVKVILITSFFKWMFAAY